MDNHNLFLPMFYCRHLQERGVCKFNERCMFSHSRSSYKVPDHVCFYYLKVSCRNSSCSFLHISASDLITQLRVLSSYGSQQENDEPSTSSERSRSAYKQKPRNREFRKQPLNLDQLKASQLHEQESRLCGICLEDVVIKQKFGLLSSCDHVFCFDCIMTWRKTKTDSTASDANNKNCPECRAPADLVVLSRRYMQGDDRKRLVEDFKKRTKEIPCRFENNGQNNCRFQDKCLYKHTLPFKPRPPVDQRRGYWLGITNANLILNSFLTDSGDEDIYISIQNAFI